MKSSIYGYLICLFLILPQIARANNEKISATDLIRKSENNIRGESQNGSVSMEIMSGSAIRTVKFDYWTKDRTKALIKILEPLKETGSGNLRVDLNLWRYLANVDRVIKIPPSMMLQSWMGSEFTYDDLVKASSLTVDYNHKIIENKNGIVVIECLPKPSAPVVWGKVIETIRLEGHVTTKREFFNERGEKLKTMTGEDIKAVGSHFIPHKLTMINHKKSDAKTIIMYTKVQYDSALSEELFTQKKLKDR